MILTVKQMKHKVKVEDLKRTKLLELKLTF